jgi:hypothetical protein
MEEKRQRAATSTQPSEDVRREDVRTRRAAPARDGAVEARATLVDAP